ncbi:MAG: hypothetical protein E4H20_07885 [Spirochaetales bacterium]|nr:MAG: hypothetical protein E4H20_07885 [Spirochaetales bacterium]
MHSNNSAPPWPACSCVPAGSRPILISMKLAIRYHSGTGNSARAAALIGGQFSALAWSVDVREIRRDLPDACDGVLDADLLLLAFPALGFSPSATMVAWLRGIPRKTGGEAAIICCTGGDYAKGSSIGGWGGDAPYLAARLLRKRGWVVTALGEASYPVNWIQAMNPPEQSYAREIIKRGDAEASAFAAGLAGGSSANPRESLARRVSGAVSVLFRLAGRRFFSTLFVADATCTSCGWCARSCPAGAITMKKGLPRWSLRCDSCNRCVNLCPTGSIQSSSVLIGLHLVAAIILAIAAFAVPVPESFPGYARAIARILLIALSPVLQFSLVAPLLGALAVVNPFRRVFSRSFMKDFRRYRAPGFRP